jgi:hypothetical protein
MNDETEFILERWFPSTKTLCKVAKVKWDVEWKFCPLVQNFSVRFQAPKPLIKRDSHTTNKTLIKPSKRLNLTHFNWILSTQTGPPWRHLALQLFSSQRSEVTVNFRYLGQWVTMIFTVEQCRSKQHTSFASLVGGWKLFTCPCFDLLLVYTRLTPYDSVCFLKKNWTNLDWMALQNHRAKPMASAMATSCGLLWQNQV